jgi:hypothetical protein
MSEEISQDQQPVKKHNTRSYADRILQALAKIYEQDAASIPEKLQAIKISSEILERRPTPRRKTNKEKLVEKALGHTTKPFGGKYPKPKEKAQP